MAKTVTFTIMHMSIAFGVVYAMTGDAKVGGAAAFVEPLCNAVGYFFHERLWERLRGARELAPAASGCRPQRNASMSAARSSGLVVGA
jgi:uncharacterized membrane protein